MTLTGPFLDERKRIYHALPRINFIGASCWVAWALTIYTGEFYAGDEASYVQNLNTFSYIISTASLFLTMVAIGLLHRKAYRLICSPSWMLAFGTVASVGTSFVVMAGAGYLGMPFFYAGNVLTGMGTAWIAQRCAVQFTELRPRDSIIMAAFVQIIAFLIYTFAISMQSETAKLVMLVSLPVIAALLTFCTYSEDAAAYGDGTKAMPKLFWRFVVGIFLLVAVFSIVRGYFPNDLKIEEFAVSRDLTTVVAILGATLIIVICAALPEGFPFGKLCYWVVVGVTFVYVISPIVGINTFYMGSALGAVNALVSLVVWSMLSSIAYRTGSSALRVFGFGFTGISLGSMVGWAFGQNVFSQLGGSVLTVINGGLVGLVLFVGFFLFNQNDFVTMVTPRDEGEDGGDSLSPSDGSAAVEGEIKPRWRLHVAALAEEKGLSARETEVFTLLAKGKDAQSIADELCVSYNTSRTHVRNIYTKCGVHSRHEFRQMIEADDRM